MELIEIIIYALKIFSLASVILLIVSYFFFKMKDRSRIKPYMLVDNDPSTYEVPETKESADVLNYKKFSERFQVVNQERFTPQYESGAFYRPVAGNIIPQNNVYNLPRTNSNQRNNGNTSTNIYNLYSPETSEPMHKLKINIK